MMVSKYCLLLFVASTWFVMDFVEPFGFELKAQQPGEWKTYTMRGEEISAMFPASPAGFITKITNKGQQRVERSYSAYTDGVVYVILSYDKIRRSESIGDIVNDFKEHHLFGAKINYERDIKIGSLIGKQYRLQWDEASGIVQVFLTEKRAYIFEAVNESQSNPSIERFLLSVTINNHSLTNQNIDKDLVSGSASPAGLAQPSPKPVEPANSENKASTVTHKAIVVLKPEPGYPDVARRSNVEGTVVLRAVLSSSGEVTDIKPVKGLPGNLTENAIEAARFLRFIPARKNGRVVSMYAQLEYNFKMY